MLQSHHCAKWGQWLDLNPVFVGFLACANISVSLGGRRNGVQDSPSLRQSTEVQSPTLTLSWGSRAQDMPITDSQNVQDAAPGNHHSSFLNYFQNYEMSPDSLHYQDVWDPFILPWPTSTAMRAAADNSASGRGKSESHSKFSKHSQHPGWPGQSQPSRWLLPWQDPLTHTQIWDIPFCTQITPTNLLLKLYYGHLFLYGEILITLKTAFKNTDRG